jgi:hypothetical protein
VIIPIKSKEPFTYKGFEIKLEEVILNIEFSDISAYRITFYKEGKYCANLIKKRQELKIWKNVINESMSKFGGEK